MNNKYKTIRVRTDNDICFIQIYRPKFDNTINACLIEELSGVLRSCETSAKIVVLEGLADVFCTGADFKEIQQGMQEASQSQQQNPEPLYNLWYQLVCGPFITIAHVRGRVNAGGIGFVAACDIVLCETRATFGLSELLFGLMPACVMPFLMRRMGLAKANYLTLMTQPISASKAQAWGLVDACEENSENLLRKHLMRLQYLNKDGVMRYKCFINSLDTTLLACKNTAIKANIKAFSNHENLERIAYFVKTGSFPVEMDTKAHCSQGGSYK
jgi:polyketide biosynthesis enoyl-CoA hydratase PksH